VKIDHMYNLGPLKDDFSAHVARQNVDNNKLSCMLCMLDEYVNYKKLDKQKLYHDYLYREESEDRVREEAIHAEEDKKAIEDYYASTYMYLLELSIQESKYAYADLYEKVLTFAHRNGVCNCFDFGGGIGGLCIHLNKNGLDCDCVDVQGNTWDYAGFRFAKNDLKVKQQTSTQLLDSDNLYDLITSTDNLEHLKDLPEWISLFNRKLKDKGFFLATSTFRGRGLHLASNQQYDSLSCFVEMMQTSGHHVLSYA